MIRTSVRRVLELGLVLLGTIHGHDERRSALVQSVQINWTFELILLWLIDYLTVEGHEMRLFVGFLLDLRAVRIFNGRVEHRWLHQSIV